VVLRTDDPLATREQLRSSDLADRTWFRFPEGTDPLWSAYWNGSEPDAAPRGEGPVVRTVHECIRAVLWDGVVGLAPFSADHIAAPAEGLTIVPLVGMPPSPLLVAWRTGDDSPLLRSFVGLSTQNPESGDH